MLLLMIISYGVWLYRVIFLASHTHMSYKSKEIYRIGHVSSTHDRCTPNGTDYAQPVGREFSSREGKLGVALGANNGKDGGLELLATMVYEATQEMKAKEREQRTAETTDGVILRKLVPELDSEGLNNGRTSI
ncbi:MAG: hypothetical protein M3441_18220 [Chloroflexota bacterium]|nr:hypothetical protein [Chloroflexota bacterium]